MAAQASANTKKSDLKARILSALVLGPLVLAAVFAGGWPFQLMIVVAAALSMREWFRLVEPQGAGGLLALAVAAVAAPLGLAIAGGTLWAVSVAGVLAAVLYAGMAVAGGRDRWVIALGVVYLAVANIATLWLRGDPASGLPLILYLLLVIWATDTGAYAAGRSIGGPKLAPRISPKKTWAGLVGGVVSAMIVGGLVAFLADAARPVFAAVLAGGLAVAGQAGDLFESAFKRRYDVKDSGSLIPGHGGLLDRLDGLFAAAPVLALFHATLGVALAWW